MNDPLKENTFYFIGVTASKSKIMEVFPLWVEALGLPKTRIKGYDIPVNGPVEEYRAIVRHIKEDENAFGALVTTHKIDILRSAGDLFDELDVYARIFGEISSISKRNGRLYGHAKDPITVGLALESFFPENYWQAHPEAVVFIMGAGGSGIALSAYLMKKEHGGNVPSRIIISNRRGERLSHCRQVHDRIGKTTEVEYVQVTASDTNDRILGGLPPGSLIVNATGMGKDRPGSPISDEALFPEKSFVWEFNYRGSLEFLHQAEAQRESRCLTVEDGWAYFIYGWNCVICEVFDIYISCEDIARMGTIAEPLRK
jgi:shikimate dehydrogenase